MARDGVAVDPDVAAKVASFVTDRRSNVAAVCRELGISRKTFYKYVARFRADGVEGFFPGSRRPNSSPSRLPVEWEDVLIAVRKEQAGQGWDYGADAVLLRLEERPDLWPTDRALPSRSTVNRVFDARGQLAKTPARKPKRKPRRFCRDRVNELWQFDGFDYRLGGGWVVVLHLTDDCSRVDLALDAAVSENGADIWASFGRAVARYGLPAAVLTDNASAFSGKRRGWTSAFEAKLDGLGVEAISSRVGHPQTCGKNERGHQRVRKWLARQPPARDLAELQAQLDTYREAFNNRRNRVLDKLTPNQRFDLGPIASPDWTREPITHITQHTISTPGNIGLNGFVIGGLGRKHAGKTATCFRNGDVVAVFIDDHLARTLTLDRTRRYQPLNQP
jgi:leucine-zipper of insertion element IS481/Integrase core domain